MRLASFLRTCSTILLIFCSVFAELAGCKAKTAGYFQGYAEGEFLFIAARDSGRLEKRWVQRGQAVAQGDPLFALERENEKENRREAEARVRTAEAELSNIETGRRQSEIDALKAELAQAEASLEFSKLQFQRQESLFSSGYVAKAAVDEAKANFLRDRDRVESSKAQLRTALQAIGREKEISAARSGVESARAALAQSDWRLRQRAVQSPAQGLVQDTFFNEGEWVAAGSPVVSLLPPANIKVRFFVPESVVGSLSAGREVSLSCDGCGQAVAAKISFISPQAEYSPPVIYSREERARLVFLVEARPSASDAVRLHPGQPVEVRLK